MLTIIFFLETATELYTTCSAAQAYKLVFKIPPACIKTC